ncbi:MAG: hypothetical protein HUU20_19440, partial [Pirellulales bacterium]|nr:hypothetical protein [Pirellulales bacterium]
HQHSQWYSLFNAFNDGWCPGEQYSSAVVGKPEFYMDEIPDRTWWAEFHSPTTGVITFLLPEIGRFSKEEPKDRGESESCLAAALAYGVPVWAAVVEQLDQRHKQVPLGQTRHDQRPPTRIRRIERKLLWNVGKRPPRLNEPQINDLGRRLPTAVGAGHGQRQAELAAVAQRAALLVVIGARCG